LFLFVFLPGGNHLFLMQVNSRNATHDTICHPFKVNASEALEIALSAAATAPSPGLSSASPTSGSDTSDGYHGTDKRYRLCPLPSTPAVGEYADVHISSLLSSTILTIARKWQCFCVSRSVAAVD
jgi:hypothetical protein